MTIKMTKEQQTEYMNLLNEAQELHKNKDVKGLENKMKEIEAFENDVESLNTAQANINALQNKIQVANLQNKGVNPMGATVIDSTNIMNDDDMYNTMEYRKAFMNHVIKGESIPSEFKNSVEVTKTTDVGAVIPTTVLEQIVEKLESTGTILNLVTKTAYKGGVSIPKSSVKPVATWVSEGKGSDKQKKTLGSITFAYHKLRCAVAVSLETETMALAVFEATLIKNITEAMVKAIEQAIITGTGEGQPKGILTETAAEGQTIEVSDLSYDTLLETEGALPLAYENNAVYCMTKKTFTAYLGIKDAQGQPIARVNYGINGKQERVLLGRTVHLCEYLDTFSETLETGRIFAFLFNFNDYVLNTNFNMGIKTYEDNDTDDTVNKAVMLVDGKVVDVNSLVILKKK